MNEYVCAFLMFWIGLCYCFDLLTRGDLCFWVKALLRCLFVTFVDLFAWWLAWLLIVCLFGLGVCCFSLLVV